MMNRAAWIGVVVGVAVLAGTYWWLYGRKATPDLLPAPQAEMPVPPVEAAPVTEPEAEPQIAHPLPSAPAQPDAPALPELEDSDAQAMGELRRLFGAQPVEAFLVPREFIRRLVLFVDSLDREALPLWLRPVRQTAGTFATETQGQTLQIAAGNEQRYAPLIAMVERADMQQVAAVYRRYYPLFQDAYTRLGNPRARYFNDRLVSVIDHLLQTPVVDEPILLARPKVLYIYADPELEGLSSGQKAMLRIGRDNAAKVKAQLREFRAVIAAQGSG